MAQESGLPAIQTRAIIKGELEEMMALEKETLVRANFDGFAVCAAITGSLPTNDAAFDPERNKFVLAICLDDSLRLSRQIAQRPHPLPAVCRASPAMPDNRSKIAVFCAIPRPLY